MKTNVPDILSRGRIRHGDYASDDRDGMRGAFAVQREGEYLVIISSGMDLEYGWEHVSVSLEKRCPTWDEMSYIKALFWSDDEAVMQLHPPKADHVNYHPYCLHLWRPMFEAIPLPPSMLVGPKKKWIR
jgi:hypothetical protein